VGESSVPRREFLKRSATTLGAIGAAGLERPPAPGARVPDHDTGTLLPRESYNDVYQGARLNRVAFPMGGIGAGMICLEGTGALSQVSIRNQPDVFNAPCVFAALAMRGAHAVARVLEGPVPGWKVFGARNAANGDEGASYGLPRFAGARFQARFPFGMVSLTDAHVPLAAEITGWSPFVPGDADGSSLPVAALEYRFSNASLEAVDAVFSFNTKNFLPLGDKDPQAVRALPGGFVLWSGGSVAEPWKEAALAAAVSDASAKVNYAWFRGGWWDPLTMAWKDVASGAAFARPPITEGDPSPGATIFVPFRLAPGAVHTVTVRLAWYAGRTNLRRGTDPGAPPPDPQRLAGPAYQPWYAGRFGGIEEVAAFWREHYDELRRRTQQFPIASMTRPCQPRRSRRSRRT
jgi:hypothetical protein